ncbi:hypothetical protein EBL84_13900 [Marichromatium sp. AB31]|nr:hypothetical protein EBL84_13900 [Marichromatium sp. AB31]
MCGRRAERRYLSRIRLPILALVGLLGGCEAPPPPVEQDAALLAGAAALLAPGAVPGPLSLPADHGAHPSQGLELWRLQARVEEADGRAHLLTLGVVRLTLATPPDPPLSAWRGDRLLWGWSQRLGPVGVAFEQRRARAVLGLAGATADPPRVWVRDWTLDLGPGRPPWRLRFEDAVGRRLVLAGGAPALGLARLAATLGAEATTAGPQGYLLPGLSVSGRLLVDGQPRAVEGRAWFEHLWAGGGEGAGAGLRLTRLTLQLDDARTLACVELRRAEAGGRPIPGCVLVTDDGRVRAFRRRELRLEAQESGAHPARWRLEIPAVALTVALTPWEDAPGPIAAGVAVRVAGSVEGRVIDGWGWVESNGPEQRMRGEAE